MRGRSRPLACIGALLLLAVARVAQSWDALPERMASHFGPGGQPNGFEPKPQFFVVFGVISGGTLLLLLLQPQLLRLIPPRLINLPHREHWLTPERFPEAQQRLASSMDWFCVALTLMLVGTLELVLRANVARAPLDVKWMIALVGGLLAFAPVWLVRLWRAFEPPAG